MKTKTNGLFMTKLDDGRYKIEDSEGFLIATCETRKMARLFSLAPDLLSASADILKMFEQHDCSGYTTDTKSERKVYLRLNALVTVAGE